MQFWQIRSAHQWPTNQNKSGGSGESRRRGWGGRMLPFGYHRVGCSPLVAPACSTYASKNVSNPPSACQRGDQLRLWWHGYPRSIVRLLIWRARLKKMGQKKKLIFGEQILVMLLQPTPRWARFLLTMRSWIKAFSTRTNKANKYNKCCFLPPCCPLLGITGWMRGGAQVQRCGATPRETQTWRHHCIDHIQSNPTKSTERARSPVFTGIRLLYRMLDVMVAALLLRFHPSEGSQTAAPRLQTPGQTGGGRAELTHENHSFLLLLLLTHKLRALQQQEAAFSVKTSHIRY